MPTELDRSSTVFVFPLTHTTLFPATTRPLNVFEPRYIQMVSDALETETEIAVAFSEPDPEGHLKRRGMDPKAPYFLLQRISPVCGVGRVHLVERRSDDTMVILLEATRKVRLSELEVGVTPYIRARAETIYEEPSLSVDALMTLRRLNQVFELWLKKTVPDPNARKLFLEKTKDSSDRINAMASLMLENPVDSQELLDLNSLSDRVLTLGLTLLDRESH